MRNVNVMAYAALGLIIMALVGALIYLEKSNVKNIQAIQTANSEKIAALEKEKEFESIENVSMENIMQKLGLIMSSSAHNNAEDAFDNFDNETKYCGTEKDFAKTYFKTIEESLSSARAKSQVAYFKSVVSSTLSLVVLCMDKNGFVNSPEKEKSICQGDGDMWPVFSVSEGAQWGGCGFEIDKKAGTFKYCATFGEIKAICTQDGCNF
ncbi:MAG: hypothetical protein ACWGHO_02490 [Candidatus Moraniibacteriota bacterium]